jgi:hypothetical protein
VPAPYGDGLQIGTDPISPYSGIVLLGLIGLVVFLYYRRQKTQSAEEVAAAAVS